MWESRGKIKQPQPQRWWRWISDPNHQRTLGFIGAFIMALATGWWQIFVYFSDTSKEHERLKMERDKMCLDIAINTIPKLNAFDPVLAKKIWDLFCEKR